MVPANTGRETFPVPFIMSLTAATNELTKSQKTTKIETRYFGGLRIDSVRLMAVQWAREHDFDVIIMVDDDMTFPADTFTKLIDHYDAGRQVVGALYYSKQWPFTPYISLKEKPTVWLPVFEENKLYEVFFIGTGVIMIDLRVFDIISKPYFLLRMDLDGRITATEDCYFGENCNLHGITCYVDTSIKAGHIRFVEFPHLFTDPYLHYRGKKPFCDDVPVGNIREDPRTDSNIFPAPIINEPVEGLYWQDGVDYCSHVEKIKLPYNNGNEPMFMCKDCGYVGTGLNAAFQRQAKELGGIPRGV